MKEAIYIGICIGLLALALGIALGWIANGIENLESCVCEQTK